MANVTHLFKVPNAHHEAYEKEGKTGLRADPPNVQFTPHTLGPIFVGQEARSGTAPRTGLLSAR